MRDQKGCSFVRTGPVGRRLVSGVPSGKGMGPTVARVSEGPPHPRPGPRETGPEAREHIGSIIITVHLPGRGRTAQGGWGGVGGVRGSEGDRERANRCVWDLLFRGCWAGYPGLRMNLHYMHAGQATRGEGGGGNLWAEVTA